MNLSNYFFQSSQGNKMSLTPSSTSDDLFKIKQTCSLGELCLWTRLKNYIPDGKKADA